MNQTSQNLFDRLTEELFAFLDDSILSTRQMLEKLTELRAAVIRRDEKSLQWMAEQMPQLTTHRDRLQQRQRQICESFAGPVNCEPGKISLSYLGRFLEIPMRNELKTKQKLLAELIGQLSREHLGTELLLRECERLNRMVLDSLVGRGNQTCIYGSAGRIQRDMHCAIMSTRM